MAQLCPTKWLFKTDISNTILTPHIAFYSQEAFIQGAEDNFKNLANFLNGKYKEAEIVNASAIEKRYPND